MNKTTNLVLGVVLGASLAGAVSAFADGGHGFGCWGGGPGHSRHDHWGHHRGEWHGRMIERISRSLSLDQAQQDKLKAVVEQMGQMRKAMRADRGADQKEVLALLSTPKLDQQKALALVKQRTERIEQQAPAMVSAIAAFTDSLSDQQRQLLAGMLAWRMGGGPGPFGPPPR